MRRYPYLIRGLLSGFEWFDEALQSSLEKAGWPQVNRTEAIIILHVIVGIVRPSDIARSLRLSRQAVHVSIQKLAAQGVFEMRPDPEDRRIKIVTFGESGQRRREDAEAVLRQLEALLEERIGASNVRGLIDALQVDWGRPPSVIVRDGNVIGAG